MTTAATLVHTRLLSNIRIMPSTPKTSMYVTIWVAVAPGIVNPSPMFSKNVGLRTMFTATIRSTPMPYPLAPPFMAMIPRITATGLNHSTPTVGITTERAAAMRAQTPAARA
jgi:hypothetical protein